MSTITVRLFHHPSRTPIAELQGVDPGATLSSLRALAERHLAAEEACMMRVFNKWHVEVVFGGRKRMIELTDEDSGSSLSSLGIEDYSVVLLEGPLTGDFEGVGQGLALVAAQVRRLEEQNADMKTILLRIAESLACINTRLSISDLEYAARLSVDKDEAKERGELLAAARSEYQSFLCFTIDTTTPHSGVKLEGPHTAVKLQITVINRKKYDWTDRWVTLRASEPLSPANHRWAVLVHEGGSGGSSIGIMLGLLPQLSARIDSEMGSDFISNLGGWCIHQSGTDINRWGSESNVYGHWKCDPLPFGKGDLVLFDYSFTDKTLTIRCGGKQVVGRIPNMKAVEGLYPAFSLYYPHQKVSFEKYQ